MTPISAFRSFLAGRRRAKQPSRRIHAVDPNASPATPGTWLVLGLGNPGRDYAHSRHNVGFWCVNRLARSYSIELKSRTSVATLGQGNIEGRDVVLAKARAFMNNSGDAAAVLVRRFRILPERLLVICDSLDLPVGTVRVRARGSHGGHKGLKSIVQRLGLDAFPRIRVGIGRPLVAGEPSYDPEVIAEYVLSDPASAERRALDEAAETVIAAVACILEQGVEAAMNRFNRDQQPEEPG
jgi:peptidyl-tRNA hydrolase, PTH1 family